MKEMASLHAKLTSDMAARMDASRSFHVPITARMALAARRESASPQRFGCGKKRLSDHCDVLQMYCKLFIMEAFPYGLKENCRSLIQVNTIYRANTATMNKKEGTRKDERTKGGRSDYKTDQCSSSQRILLRRSSLSSKGPDIKTSFDLYA